tara:strand:+ start:881 stop:1525 length:645 start_codon:yes stop_codon:yes gene_type:complete
MKKILFILVLLPNIILSQNNGIKNINVDFNNEILEIGYDFEYPNLVSSYYNISLIVYEGKTLLAKKDKRNKFIYGDIGFGIYGGNAKKISWNVIDDNIELVGDNLIFEILAKEIKKKSLINMMFPGRYNYLINRKKIHFTKSVLFYTSLAAGIYFGNISINNQEKYNNATNLNDINKFYDKANISLQASYLSYGISTTLMLDNIFKLFKKNKQK